MLAQIVDPSVHSRLTETNWNSENLSSPSSTASTFEYDAIILDSIKSDFDCPTQDSLMFTDDLGLPENQKVETLKQKSDTSDLTQCKPNALTQSPAALLGSSFTPPLSAATEDNFISSNVGGYEMYDEPLSSCAPPTNASEVLFQQSNTSKTRNIRNNLEFQSEQLDLSKYLQSGYNANDKLGLEKESTCKENSLSELNITTTASEISSEFRQPRHFNQTLSNSTTSTQSNFSTSEGNIQSNGEH